MNIFFPFGTLFTECSYFLFGQLLGPPRLIDEPNTPSINLFVGDHLLKASAKSNLNKLLGKPLTYVYVLETDE